MRLDTMIMKKFCLDVFATGGRDGQIRLWDSRTSTFQKQGQQLKKPVNIYRNAHVIKDFRTPPKRKSTPLRLSNRLEKVEPPSVTSLVYANEYMLISASSNAKSGLKIWDTRKIAVKEEGHALSVLEVPINKDAGMRLESLYFNVQASPVSDHILCGSKNQQAVLWDLQDLHNFSDEHMSSAKQGRAAFPMFTLNGHDSEVCCVSWSRAGKYIASMDDEHLRIWSADTVKSRNKEKEPNSNLEGMIPYQLKESEKTMLLMNRMSIAQCRPDTSAPVSNTPSRKRKEPFASPIKRLKTPTKSPNSKIMK
ncbi:WD domain, G-beta repeat protein [Necator americanus]|uniref:WD domain, G-beta repeat protein n=1 Tax=Necator americanus TaxID=51031 RepID=W2TBE0_NECAM|nr:WD domain, G-beta repeat protein [Necator americanus]ETN79173.1 WD domain, G-beta repeat protein [Necator americanus]